MATVETDIVIGGNLMRIFKRLADLDNQPAMRAAKRQVGTLALQDQRRHYAEASEHPSAAGWPDLSPVTVILRPGGTRIYGDADIETKRRSLKVLRDGNRMYASLTPSAPGNVFDLLPQAVRVGTNVTYADTHQSGGHSTFRFGAADEKRFRRNVSRTKRGFKAPPASKDGKRRSWKRAGKESPWNPFFFRWLAVLRGMRGKRFPVPPRPFVREPTQAEAAKYARIVEAAIAKML